jgi:tRNA pseudouridine32 synthase/23S rRNA pseudouridine746 synthase/23S rRNA pseudouridine1911/1915/1917 synthase
MQDRLLYRDDRVLIIDKPAGLAVHPGGTGVAHLGPHLDDLRFDQLESPKLAHRLDRGTSGCLVLGRTREALKQLGRLFASGRVEKRYWALTLGAPPEESGLIDKPLLKLDPRRGKMAVDPAGQEARSEWRILGQHGDIAWLELTPITGRSHQLRAHLASIGCPILGDRLYGAGDAAGRAPELCLLARRISLPLYWQQPPITAEAAPPAHMLEGLAACGFAG